VGTLLKYHTVGAVLKYHTEEEEFEDTKGR
jgi:hypothetical protein